MLVVLLVSTGNGSNSLTVQSQFVLGASRSCPGCASPRRATQRCCQHGAGFPGCRRVLPARGQVSGGPEGAARGEGRQQMQYQHRHLLPSAQFCLPRGGHLKPSGSSPKERLFGRKQTPLCEVSFKNPTCSKTLPGKVVQQPGRSRAQHPLTGGGAALGQEPSALAAAEDHSQMPTLNPGPSTQPKSERGDFPFQARPGALGEPPQLAAAPGCLKQAVTGRGEGRVMLAAS